ncbi:30S ribosomal protein S17 [Candidatus Woesearchaeota archaeon]|nr:30S ribosomal protein S17 [Candidatus Woesearchaeota archaeon]
MKTAKKQEKKNAQCMDKHCPVHGHAKVRGRHFIGTVKKIYSKTATVEWEWTSFVKKYERYLLNRSRVKAHVPDCIEIKAGDVVEIGESRPISKTKSFIVIRKEK